MLISNSIKFSSRHFRANPCICSGKRFRDPLAAWVQWHCERSWMHIGGLFNTYYLFLICSFVFINLAIITGGEEAILCCNDTSSEEIVYLACHSWLSSPGSWYLSFILIFILHLAFSDKLLVSSCCHLHVSLERFQVTFSTYRWAVVSDHFWPIFISAWS